MFKAVYDRIHDILLLAQTDLATSSIVLTVPEAVPEGSQRWEQYIAIVGMRPWTFTQAQDPNGDYFETLVPMSIPLDVMSKPIQSDWDYSMQTGIMIVADAVLKAFNRRPRLELNNQGMDHLNPAVQVKISSGSFTIEPFPQGSQHRRYFFSAVLSLEYQWTCEE